MHANTLLLDLCRRSAGLRCPYEFFFFCYVQASEVIFALFYLLTNGMCFYVQASELQVELPLNLSFYLGLS